MKILITGAKGFVGQNLVMALKNIQEGKHIDTRTIDALCKFLNCQPGDILEYVEEEEE